jgi:hypothetical protein
MGFCTMPCDPSGPSRRCVTELLHKSSWNRCSIDGIPEETCKLQATFQHLSDETYWMECH